VAEEGIIVEEEDFGVSIFGVDGYIYCCAYATHIGVQLY